MSAEEGFLQAILSRPSDLALRLIFADWLEEQGDPRAELLRLLHELTQAIDIPGREGKEARLRELLAGGVRPVGPFCTNSVGMRFACIPPGTFRMGSPPAEEGRRYDETLHPVTLTRGFFLGVSPVTQDQWRAVMGNAPSHFKGDDLPVESVSWEDCQMFCKRLGEGDGKRYRLPTEAEWEYACRAGTTSPFHFGETLSTDQANYNGDYTYGQGKKGVFRKQTTPVGSFPPNAWGLHDMHGNVWEWCSDWYGPYPPGDQKDPPGADNGIARVLRGGSWQVYEWGCRAAHRDRSAAGYSFDSCGCRVVLSLD